MKESKLDILLKYYTAEMNYLVKEGNVFAEKYSKAGQNIDWNVNQSNDPHIQRLLESFAFLSASLNYRIDNANTNLSQSIIAALLPQFVRPVPSMTIMSLNIANDAADNFAGDIIPARTEMRAESLNGESFKFQTVYDTQILPLEIESVAFEEAKNCDLPLHEGRFTFCLKIRLMFKKTAIKNINCDTIRFYINKNNLEQGDLYEMIFAEWNNTTAHSSNQGNTQTNPVFLSADDSEPYKVTSLNSAITQVGFDFEQCVFNSDKITDHKFKLMLEFAMLKEKFMFFDVYIGKTTAEETLDIIIPLNSSVFVNKMQIPSNTLKLMCVPVVNLFKKTTEAVRIDYRSDSYKLVPDRTYEHSMEIYSVNHIKSLNTDALEYRAYLAFDNLQSENTKFWTLHRHLSKHGGNDVFVKFVNGNIENFEKEKQISPFMSLDEPDTVFADVTCTNRLQAAAIPIGTIFDIDAKMPGIAFESIMIPTTQVEFPIDGNFEWKAISHLIADHIGLTHANMNDEQCLKANVNALKNLVCLYELVFVKQLSNSANAICSIQCFNSLAVKISKYGQYFVPKIEIHIILDDSYKAANVFLLGRILHEIFKRSSGFNTVIETIILKKTDGSVWKRYNE
jgi:type VI secretion system protein ImpG